MNNELKFPLVKIPKNSLEAEISGLEARVALLKFQKDEKEAYEEYEEREVKNKRLIITYSNYQKNYKGIDISLSKPDMRVVSILRRLPTFVWNGSTNNIRLTDIKNFIKMLEEEKVEHDFVWSPPELAQTVLDIINKPHLTITLTADKRRVDIEPSIYVAGSFYPTGLDSFRYGGVSNNYYLEPNELWRLSLILAKAYPHFVVKYDKGSLALLDEQNKRRNIISELGTATDCPEVEVPLIGGDKFHGFQRVALKFAEVTDYNCLLALDMGLGKTPISIAIAEKLKARVLFIVPATLKTNTYREIKKWTGKEALILSGSSPDGLTIDCLIKNKTQYNIINYDVIGKETITEKSTKIGVPDSTVMKWVEIINYSNFDLIVCDEIHYIKNMNSLRSKGVRAIKAPHKIGLSGTPIVNRPKELYPSLNVVAPTKFQRESDFQNAFLDKDGNPKNIARLHELLQDYMFRRKKEDVIKELPPITRINHFYTLSAKAKIHYDKALAGLYVSLRNPSYQRDIHSILAELTRLKQIISDDKVQATVELAQTAYEETGEKVLIFSQFVETCQSIAGLLDHKLIITGQHSDTERYDRIDKFQNDPAFRYMVLSTKAGAEGITLTKAHTVIFNDLCWTPKDHRQAEARCYGRMSDMHGAIAYYVQAEGTVDEMIAELLMKKLAIIEEVVDNLHTSQDSNDSLVNELISKLRMKL